MSAKNCGGDTDYEMRIFAEVSEGYEENLRLLAEEKGLPVESLRVPIPDTGIPTVTRMKMILDEIDGALDRGETVYVHCLRRQTDGQGPSWDAGS